MNPLRQLAQLGQSVYLDELGRGMLRSGDLARLIDEDGLHGVTSNPAIFEKSIARTDHYDDAIADLAKGGIDGFELYETLVIEDIQNAADLFRERYRTSDGRHGYVSLEVAPDLAHDTEGTVAEARRLWQQLDRPNVFIKVPGTAAGLTAIEQLISEGVNVNVTLLFGLDRYADVAEAYVRGLEARAERGEPLDSVASVASFFLSRIDVAIDPELDRLAAAGGDVGARAKALRGTAAINSAKGAWQRYQELFGGERFARLAALGARPQWLLWASTGTKDPAYPATMYVEPLIGADTVTTLPRETLDAYRTQGEPAPRLDEGLDAAKAQLAELAEIGIDLDAVTATLEKEGVAKFVQPFDALMDALREAIAEARG